jgi:hypothetical protein
VPYPSPEPGENYARVMMSLLALMVLVAVGGVASLFFVPIRPFGLIAIAAAVSGVSAVLGVDRWRMLAPVEQTRRAAAALLVSKTGTQVIIAGMLSLLFAGWRTLGVTLIVAGGTPVVLAHVLTRGQPPWRQAKPERYADQHLPIPPPAAPPEAPSTTASSHHEPQRPRAAAVPSWIGLVGGFITVGSLVAVIIAGDRSPLAIGVSLATGIAMAFAGIGCSLLLGSAHRARVRHRWLRWAIATGLTGYVTFGAGIVLMTFAPTRVTAVLMMCAAAGLIVGGRRAVKSVDHEAPAEPGPQLRRLLVIAALLPLALLGGVGQLVRLTVDYVGMYGTPVAASPGSQCVTTFGVNGPARGWQSTECPNSTYTIDGVTRFALLKLGRDESVASREDRIPAYALGNRLVSRHLVGRIDPVTVLGHYLPPWLLLATAAEAVLIALRLHWTRRRRRHLLPS